MQQNENEINEGIIVPPGCDGYVFEQSGEPVYVFTPDSYKPYTGINPEKRLPHNMSRKAGGISVPKNDMPAALKSMTQYMQQFMGAYICLDLWMNNHTRIKKCGYLTDVGESFLVIRDCGDSSIKLIDLKPVRYISIYCK